MSRPRLSTLREMAYLLDKEGWVWVDVGSGRGRVRVKVVDARISYGRLDVRVSLAGGDDGVCWIDRGRVELDGEDGR